MNRLAAVVAIMAAAVALSQPAFGGNRRGDKLVEKGRVAEAQRDYDAALAFYEQALTGAPTDAGYQLHVRRVRFAAAQAHVDKGQKLRTSGDLEGALAEFQRAFTIDPSSSIADQEMRRTNQMMERESKKKSGGQASERGLTPSELARKQAEGRAASIQAMPELKPISREVTNLKMVNQPPKVLYQTVAKLAGINVLFDADYNDTKPQSIDLNRATLDEALDYISLLTKTYWKPISANAIFVTQDNVTKRRDYEEHLTRVFYMQNLTSPQELQEAMTGMRTVTDVRKIFPVNSQSAIVVRGTADQIALAEKILLDLDKPKPEVIVDVIVMEASRTKGRNLAFTPTIGGKNGIGTTVTPASGSALSELKNLGLGKWSMTLPGGLVQALMSDSGSKVLTTPQVRATDGQKASLRIGDRYPYATGSYQPGVGSVGVSPLVSTQFQFAEVGINVDVTPRIHANDEVSMQVEFEISNIRDKVDVGGLSQPVIGQRKVSHIIRVREGEATLIGGLMQNTATKGKSGVAGLANIPILGRFFSGENVETITSDLLVVLVPHIVRSPDVTTENLRAIATGSEQIYKLNYAPAEEQKSVKELVKPGEAVKPGPAAPKPTPVVSTPGNPTGLPMAGPGGAAAPAVAAPPAVTAPPATGTAPPAAPPQPQAAAPGGPAVALVASAKEVEQNATFTMALDVDHVTELFTAPMRLRYDNKTLKLLEVTKGTFLGGDGQAVTFSESKSEENGLAVVTLSRVPGAGGISGSGTLVLLKFQALAKGTTAVGFEQLEMRDAKLQPLGLQAPTAAVVVK